MRFGWFIDRPVFATVCSLLVVLAGALAIPLLPVSAYPPLAAPQVNVTATYLGADAQTVESAVTTPLEQAINGVSGMRYLQSESSSDGTATVVATFDVDREIDLAAVDVQNRINQVMGRLPAEVRATGVTVSKSSSAMALAAAMYSEEGKYSIQFVSNYLDVGVKEAIKRIEGVANVQVFGDRRYAMRVWLDPARLAARRLTARDVVTALREQNVQIAAGQLGQEPAPQGQSIQFSLRVTGRLGTATEFQKVVVRRAAQGGLVRLEDVGRAELGSEDYSTILRFDGREAVGFGVYLLPTANALRVQRDVRALLDDLSRSFPPGLKIRVAFDPTDSVRASIEQMLYALGESLLLVIAVMYLFLRGWRATALAAAALPVSLIGTFVFVRLFDYSINTLTLFGLTLATGLVVDDAIVVIENIARHVAGGAGARSAALHSTREVAGAVIATSFVLVAVFVPLALFPGVTGRIYRQFALTISFSMLLSAFVALTLTPALAAIFLPGDGHQSSLLLGRMRYGYVRLLSRLVRRPAATAIVLLVAFSTVFMVHRRVPRGFVPTEDSGYFMVVVQAPPGGSVQQTMRITREIEHIVRAQDEVTGMFSVNGMSPVGAGGNNAVLFVNMKRLKDRPGEEHATEAVIRRVRPALRRLSGAVIMAFQPPVIPGLGAIGGFELQIQDRGGGSFAALASATQDVQAALERDARVDGVFAPFTADDPQVLVTIERDRATALGVGVEQIADAAQAFVGAVYVNDFELDNRTYRVYVQGEAGARAYPADVRGLYVRSDKGEMVPLDGLVTLRSITAPQTITHHNLFRSSEISGTAASGVSTREAMVGIRETLQRVLPQGMSFEWTGAVLEEQKAGGRSAVWLGLGALCVYLVLAAQYESFVLPLIVILSVPLALLGGLLATWARGFSNDVFCQMGLLILVGLASKNAILVVEFAEQARRRGLGAVPAVIEAAGVRLRPILMTSFSFILGVLPLVFASGAGQNARRALGTTVLGGMVVATTLNLLLVPSLYVLIEGRRRRWGESNAVA